jgi:peptidoglycan/LPS O-acetylase OafA/YrhL
MGRSNKLLGLEVVRFLSAVAILVTHYGLFAYIGETRFADPPSYPLYSALWPLYDYGFWGVQVFWCVSGFVFTWKYLDAIKSGEVDGRKFFVLRFSRLYPLHFVTLLVMAALQQVYLSQHGFYFHITNNTVQNFVLQLFMASNWISSDGTSFNFPIWSISIEVLVYAIFFALIRYASASMLMNVAILAICVGAKALRIWHPLFDCLAFFYVGGLSAQLFMATRAHPLRRAIGISALSAVTVATVAVFAFRLHAYKHFELLFLMSYTPALLFVVAREWTCGKRTQAVIEACGNMTYSSYLLHFPVQLAVVLTCEAFGVRPPIHSGTFMLAYLVVILAMSRACYVYFEKPAQDAIRRNFLLGSERAGRRKGVDGVAAT